ncbi:serine/threonine-protein kinase Sgk2 [Nemania abortiva]|nr:serine/threonine-protein kinase Sgk2 [Nemania abortiva]
MLLTERHNKIIQEYPLDVCLNHIKVIWANNPAYHVSDSNGQRSDVSSLLICLTASKAASHLPAPDGGGNIGKKLHSMIQPINRGIIKPSHFRALIRCVNANVPDLEVWEAVFLLVEDLSAIAPPIEGLPVRASADDLPNYEEREILEREVFFEIKDCNVGGFCDKFFNPKTWTKEQRDMLGALMAEHDGKKWTGFPPIPNERLVWAWLHSLEDSALANAPHKLHTTQKDQTNIFFRVPVIDSGDILKYKNVLVVGKQKSYDDGFEWYLIRLARYVRGVFFDQPTRRFVHAFTLYDSIMELWVFDRSGAYSSGPFDIHDEPNTFARALVSYATMDDDAMGLDTFIKRENIYDATLDIRSKETGAYRYITLDDDVNGNETRFRMAGLVARPVAVVGRGTTCFGARKEHETRTGDVAKFSWASDKRKPEIEQLKLAEKRGVKGIARVVAHRQITTIAELREGLEFREPYCFEALPWAPIVTHSLDLKHGLSSDHTADKPKSKKRRPDSPESKSAQKLHEELSADKTKSSSHNHNKNLWENKVHSCLVTSPAGRVVSDFGTIKELLEAMRDAIKAHQSLYMTGNILHRDISSNNIIITEPETADGFKGMLIDLDQAKVGNSSPDETKHHVGTMPFMALEVLETEEHTYRHDLESFLYVLLWMCARQSWCNGLANGKGERPPEESLLRYWQAGSFKSIARAKKGDMMLDGFEEVMEEFPEAFNTVRPLCLKVREILFVDVERPQRLVLGTPEGDPGQLYRPIIEAYDKTISCLENVS